MKRFTLIALCLMAALSCSAYDFEKDGFYYNITSFADLTVQLTTSGDEKEYGNIIATYSGDIVVPKTVEYAGKTFTVTSINPFAFIGCSLPSLTIPETVVDIDIEVENRNMGLAGYFKKLIIEDSDTPIHCFRALISCFNGDVTESVYLGRNIEEEQSANIVYDAGSYKEITFGEKVTFLNDVCPRCNNLTSVVLPKNIKSLSGTFKGCENLVSVSGEGVEFASRAFAGCEKLTTINLPSVRMIGGAFSNCPYTSFVVPQGVVSMTGAFNGCSYLETITIPGTVVELGPDEYNPTFGGCNALKTIIVGNPTPIQLCEKNFEAMVYLNATLKVPVGAAEAYKAAEGWKNFANIEEDASITDDIFTLELNSYQGKIEVNVNEALPAFEIDYYTYKFVKKGEPIEIKAVPDDHYKLSILRINGVDVISEVVDNVYKTTVTGGMSITARFEYDEPEPDPVFLTIRQADNGCLRQLINKKESFTFYIEPADGWKLHTVTLNGKDITSEVGSDGMLEIGKIKENTELSVSYEKSSDAVYELNSSRAKVYAYDGTLFISNAEVGDFVYVYNEAGVNVAMRKIGSSMESIQVEKGHVYIVKLKDKTVKLSI